MVQLRLKLKRWMVKIDKDRAATYVTRAERVKAVNAIKTGSDTEDEGEITLIALIELAHGT